MHKQFTQCLWKMLKFPAAGEKEWTIGKNTGKIKSRKGLTFDQVMRMAATLKDIANYVGTSVTTVSKVLGNREIRVSEVKRREILEVAEKLNYLPNASGVNLKKGSTDAIAVIVGDLLYPYYAKLLKQIAYCLNEHGKSIIVCDADNDFRMELQHYQRMNTGYVDGAIIVPSPLTVTQDNVKTALKVLGGLDLPITFVCHGLSSFDCYSTVGTPPYECGYLAAKHLLELGHRRIAYVSESLEQGVLNPKLQGFRAALKEFEVDYRGELTLYGHARYIGGSRAYEKLAASDMTAAVCSDDLLAIGFLSAASADGRSIPQDLSVVGMDNIMATLHTTPKITTVAQDTEQIARNAVDLLLEQIDARRCGRHAEVTHIAIEPTLMVRQSTDRA